MLHKENLKQKKRRNQIETVILRNQIDSSVEKKSIAGNKDTKQSIHQGILKKIQLRQSCWFLQQETIDRFRNALEADWGREGGGGKNSAGKKDMKQSIP